MEQPKKPGPGKDIADLKARLGLAKGPAAAPSRPGAPPVPGPSAIPNPLVPPPMAPSPFAPPPAPMGMGVPSPVPATAPVAASAAAPRFDDPFAAMRPPEGKHFDFAADDGKPAVTVHRKTAAASMVILGVAVLVAGSIGFGFGASAVGRRAFNQANFGAKRVKTELDDMNKTVTQIAVAVQMSQQRLAATKQDPSAYDYKLIEELEMVKLDPRPDTSRIFKVNYFLLEDLAIDRLMNYYYDTINLFGEVERHIKRTKADKTALEAFATKEASKGGNDPSKQVNYGVVFDSRGKLAIASMVEVGKPVCKGGGEACDAKEIDGFQIRSNTGANWTPRKVGPKPEGDKVVPIERTPLFDAVMSGSPEQVRMEQYKQRYNNIRLILQRLSATKKELNDAMDKAASRPDLVSPMSKICG